MLPSVLLTAWFSLAGAQSGLAMPPPPPGMRELSEEEEAKLLLDAAAEDEGAPDDPAVKQQVDDESLELEELRALEEVTLTPEAQADAELLRAMRRLGLGNPLRHRMADALADPDLPDDPDRALIRVTDVAAFDARLVEDRYDIPVEMQPLVAQYIQFFQGPGRKWFRNWMNRSTRFIPVMQPILAEAGLPRDTVYLAMIESGFSAHAYSWAHASGPWQFISSTGKQYGLKQDFWVDERRDPIKSTRAAARYLQDLHREMGHWYLAWASYNAGGGRLRRMINKTGSRDFWVISETKGLAKETKHYVPKLIAAALVAKHPQAFGFSDEEFSYLPPLEYDEIQLPSPTDLEVIARAAGVTTQEVADLNPELKRWCTPPASDQKPYVARIPKGTATTFAENYKKLAPRERLTFKVHKVRRGDTLSQIAQSYRSAPEAIMQLNRLRNARALRVNSELVIPVPSRSSGGPAVPPVIETQAARARRSGFVAHRPEEEVPAGTANKAVASGPIRTEVIGGKTRVTYAVQGGDSLWAIGQRFNVSVDELRRWNGLSVRARRLSVGTELFVWPRTATTEVQVKSGTVVADTKPAPAGAARKTLHKLAPGETLWSVAQRYNVSVDDIKRWNGITNHRSLQAGTTLTLMVP